LNALIAAPAIGGGAFFERISNLQFAAIGVIMLIVFAYVFFRLLREPRVPEELRGQLREVQADIASA